MCREPNGTSYYWGRLKIGTTSSAPGLVMDPEPCADGATTVAHGHTHPTQTTIDPVTHAVRYNWPDEYPSGFRAEPAYNAAAGSDLKNADLHFDLHPGQPRYQDVNRYLASPSFVPTQQFNVAPTGAATFLRYKKTAYFHAKDNIYRYKTGTDTWEWIGPASWQ